MRFPDFDLIVEAKRWDDEMQNSDQWNAQLIAYVNEYADEDRLLKVRMIALGGIRQKQDSEIRTVRPIKDAASSASENKQTEIVCPVHMCRWSGLLVECLRMERELGRMNYLSSESGAHRRILKDLIGLFGCHGFQTGTWFGDGVPKLLEKRISTKPIHFAFKP